MEKIVKEFKGYSGSKIYLMQINNEYFVRKQGNVVRNYERLCRLHHLDFSVVKILNYDNDILDIEYIPGLDIKNYLLKNNPKFLAKFIVENIKKLKQTEEVVKDYTNIYFNKLGWVDSIFSFTNDELINRLPKLFNQSEYIGDFTLENILFNKEKGFIIIDPATIEYDSWHFDLAKLNQDLTCKWFIRNCNINLDAKLSILKNFIEKDCGEINNTLTIIMLIRILKHAQKDQKTKQFLLNQIEKLWKL